MQEFKEFTAKTAEEAIEEGLKELGLTKETAQIRILEEGKKKLFGTVKARVEIAPLCANDKEKKEEPALQQEKTRARKQKQNRKTTKKRTEKEP